MVPARDPCRHLDRLAGCVALPTTDQELASYSDAIVSDAPNYRLERRGMDKVPSVKRTNGNLRTPGAHGFAGAAQPRR
jgi:hypothetical protein